MPISTICSECSRKLRVPDDLIGKRVKCPSCGYNFTVTAEEEPAERAGGSISAPPVPAPAEDPGYEEVPEEPPLDDDGDQQDQDNDRDDDDDSAGRGTRKKKKRRRRSRNRDGYLQPHRGQLIMILGIISIPLFFATGGVPGLAMGVVAWIMGNSDLKEMREGRMDPSGESETNVGRICGMISAILGMLGLAAAGVYVLFMCCMFGAIFGGGAGAGGFH